MSKLDRYVMTFLRFFVLFVVGGLIYASIEIIYRGYTHWTMVILGGLCFTSIGEINEFLSWDTPLLLQMLISSVIVTALEFICGCVLNLWLHLNIWDYSNLPFNVLGQICLPFTVVWYFLSLLAIVYDDYFRYVYFKEEKPRYKLLC